MIVLKNKILVINNRRTSMRLCSEEWNALGYICKKENINRNTLIENLDSIKVDNMGLTSLTRLFLLLYYQNMATPPKDLQNSASLLSYIFERFKVCGINITK